EPWTSDEQVTRSGPASATGPATGAMTCSTKVRSASRSAARSALSARRATTADTALGSPARNRAKCGAIPVLPQARQGLALLHIAIMTNYDGDLQLPVSVSSLIRPQSLS